MVRWRWHRVALSWNEITQIRHSQRDKGKREAKNWDYDLKFVIYLFVTYCTYYAVSSVWEWLKSDGFRIGKLMRNNLALIKQIPGNRLFHHEINQKINQPGLWFTGFNEVSFNLLCFAYFEGEIAYGQYNQIGVYFLWCGEWQTVHYSGRENREHWSGRQFKTCNQISQCQKYVHHNALLFCNLAKSVYLVHKSISVSVLEPVHVFLALHTSWYKQLRTIGYVLCKCVRQSA